MDKVKEFLLEINEIEKKYGMKLEAYGEEDIDYN